ncbi:MAG: 2-amino-4-hydroxy-6-hydroxymethyldihydropteridine diphosphokinase [Candidatus Omnitrophica bacterium]|nr:2-amino-4-hydroxy-6-hydroxymethyldihydropteridine diphosphokinase [Candidatus Omnitrophota bacterium]
MPISYLALGSNLGNRHSYMERALEELKKQGIEILKTSSIIETDPVGGPVQSKYLNAVLKVKTSLLPEELLLVINAIEKKLGRIREIINGPRVIDIDILLYDDVKLISHHLMIPHPRMRERKFVMNPLKEIAPDIVSSLCLLSKQ